MQFRIHSRIDNTYNIMRKLVTSFIHSSYRHRSLTRFGHSLILLLFYILAYLATCGYCGRTPQTKPPVNSRIPPIYTVYPLSRIRPQELWKRAERNYNTFRQVTVDRLDKSLSVTPPINIKKPPTYEQ